MSVNFMHALASPNLSHAASKAVVLNCDGSGVPVKSLRGMTGWRHADRGKQSDPISSSEVMNMEEEEESNW